MNGRPYTRADYLAIKSATRRSCEDAGPLHEIAANTRADTAALSRYGNAERPEFIPIDVAMDLDALSGGDRILRAWAEMRGYDLVREEKGIAVEDARHHVSAVLKETGEAIIAMGDVVGPKAPTPLAAARAERELDDVIDAAERARADMRRIRAVS
ncbi:hypothetical protein [Tardiphaga sp.]|uniref:hypothetical protein n=1 Tax=Tardiphaga sp. TaxID=1926292 RepID=UPI002632B8D9|nr:hypothetical protein [Tardiphaga sp.]MDB5620544.1 hypothetical protein [Tardiphaga sp.]